jgi:hypothetical protein
MLYNKPYTPQISGMRCLTYTGVMLALLNASCIERRTIPITLNNIQRMERRDGWLHHNPIVQEGVVLDKDTVVVPTFVGMDDATGTIYRLLRKDIKVPLEFSYVDRHRGFKIYDSEEELRVKKFGFGKKCQRTEKIIKRARGIRSSQRKSLEKLTGSP